MAEPTSRTSASYRQEEVARFILSQGSATIAEISETYGVSVMTVHRDLNELARQGVIRKFRGGASAQPSGVFESSVRYRMSSMLAARSFCKAFLRAANAAARAWCS